MATVEQTSDDVGHPVASIQQRRTKAGDVSWRVQYRVNGQARSDTVLDLAEAIRHQRAVERLGGEAAREVLLAREGVAHEVVTLAAYAKQYVAEHRGITDGTRVDYRRMVENRLKDSPLGELPVEMVTTRACERWLDGLGLAGKTVRNYQALLSAVLAHAVKAGLRPDNPARGIKVATTSSSADRVFLNAGEQAVLVAALPALYVPLVVTLLGTGLRWGEATALQVGDVDLDAPVPLLYVRRAWKRTGKRTPELGPPKSAAGLRTVSLPPQVVEQLRPLLEGRHADEFVFTVASKPVRHDRFHLKVWRPTIDRLNASGALTKRPRIHDLRHTHVSGLLAAGLRIEEVQARVGHEDISTTVNVYGHLTPDHLARAAAASSVSLRQAVPELEA